jgi:SNF2 family DNA or RNA helicase
MMVTTIESPGISVSSPALTGTMNPLKYSFKEPKPFSHQKKALNKIRMLNGVCGLFMGMGTGKTRVVIDWAGIAYHNYGLRRVVVVCPVSVTGVWKRQIRMWSPVPSRIAILHGPVSSRIRLVKLMQKNPRPDAIEWVILNYESIWRENSRGESLEDVLRKWKPQLVVADESHKIKSSTAKQSRSLSRLASTIPMRLALSGTPITKSPLDVYGQFRFLDPTIFAMSWTSFKRTYGVWGGYGGYRLRRYKNLASLAKILRSHSYRIRKEQCLDLPERVGDLSDPNGPQLVSVQLSPKAAAFYTEMAKQMIIEIKEDVEATAPIVLTKLLRLSQITSGFIKDTEGVVHEFDTSKLDMAIDLITDMVEQDEKVVVFVRFIHDYQRLSERLTEKHIGHVILSGSVPSAQRDGLVQKFSTDPEVPVFISQIASGSLGIDLTAASLCIFYSWDYRYDSYVQAVDRLHRQGQTRRCTYYHLAVPGSIDTVALEILKDKGNLAHAVVHDPNILRPNFPVT